MNSPLVSCIMPTYGRPDYVAESMAMFLAQDYSNKELLILNDCPGQTLSGDFPDVRIINSPTRWTTLGDKRNALIEMAQGEWIAVWDDDDIYLPWRLSQAITRLQDLKSSLYCPAEFWAYWGSDQLHDNQALLDWIYHPLVVFQKSLWKVTGGYPPRTKCEDTEFMRKILKHLSIDWPRDAILRCDRPMIMRGKSKYQHTSIGGGELYPDIRAEEIQLAPLEIQDPVLRRARDHLIRERKSATRMRRQFSAQWKSWPGIGADVRRRWLDELPRDETHVGYGQLGESGRLGYEDQSVTVCGQHWSHALSAHAPSRLVYKLDGSCAYLGCFAAINDDVLQSSTTADFLVYADDRLVAVARNVSAHQVPRMILADIRGATRLELVVHPLRWDYCHSVWVDPILIAESDLPRNRQFVDCLQRAELKIPHDLPAMETCVATVGSIGFEHWIDDLFGSVVANSQLTGIGFVIFAMSDSPELRRVADRYQARIIPCRPLRAVNLSCKSLLYSIGHVIPATRFLCLDADTLVLDDLRPVIAAIDVAPPGAILCCREGNRKDDFPQEWQAMYAGTQSEMEAVQGGSDTPSARHALVVNDGLFAGSRAALCGLDAVIRGFQDAAAWVDDSQAGVPWRNQAIFNLALATAQLGQELDPRFNAQLHSQSIEVQGTCPQDRTVCLAGRPVAVLHFNGSGRHQAAELRNVYRGDATFSEPTSGPASYEEFLTVLKKWVSRHGREKLAWSFYGTTNGASAQITDSATFPLLATLHYLIRSNGCHRVIETGTARGISAACLASAVAHRPHAKVVTIDHERWPDCQSLWAGLPDAQRRCLEARQVDALQGLQQALAAGESYQAALLDSVHTAEHVLQEFHLATQLVCPGGLILVHDAIWAGGTVATALREISRSGYGVVRLWTADEGTHEDDHLGLAVIENRRYDESGKIRGESRP